MNVNGTLIANKMGKGTLLYRLSSRSSLTEDGSDRGADSAEIWLKLACRKKLPFLLSSIFLVIGTK